MPTSRYVPGRFPAPSTSPIADAIRERRGARGLTPLDGTLLHVPAVAQGWNSLLGAIRTKGSLPGDVREIMILRVAARNGAAFEWIHHEHVGRDAGLSTAQLAVIRDTVPPLPSLSPSSSSPPSILSELQSAALSFADASTTTVAVPPSTTLALKDVLRTSLANGDEEKTEDLLVEAAAVVATYNMVSRFLVSLDVAGFSSSAVPWPADVSSHQIPLYDAPESFSYVQTHVSAEGRPWIVFCNSLLTNTSLWEASLPYLLEKYNVILHDQRGHGQSSSSLPTENSMSHMSTDIHTILTHLHIPSAHAVIGVSQGGAVALAFASHHPERTRCVVACDTSPATPAGNKGAWDERIALAREQGMKALSGVTVPRWFPAGSSCHPATKLPNALTDEVAVMVESTSVDGFALGARALQEYDLWSEGLAESPTPMLLVAGELDGGGNVGKGLQKAQERLGEKARFVGVEKAGHLPMVDETRAFWGVVRPFLDGL